MGFYPRLSYEYEFPYTFPERAAALLKKIQGFKRGDEPRSREQGKSGGVRRYSGSR